MKKRQLAYILLSLLAVVSVKVMTFGLYFLISHLQSLNQSDDPFNYFREGRDWTGTCKTVGGNVILSFSKSY